MTCCVIRERRRQGLKSLVPAGSIREATSEAVQCHTHNGEIRGSQCPEYSRCSGHALSSPHGSGSCLPRTLTWPILSKTQKPRQRQPQCHGGRGCFQSEDPDLLWTSAQVLCSLTLHRFPLLQRDNYSDLDVTPADANGPVKLQLKLDRGTQRGVSTNAPLLGVTCQVSSLQSMVLAQKEHQPFQLLLAWRNQDPTSASNQ